MMHNDEMYDDDFVDEDDEDIYDITDFEYDEECCCPLCGSPNITSIDNNAVTEDEYGDTVEAVEFRCDNCKDTFYLPKCVYKTRINHCPHCGSHDYRVWDDDTTMKDEIGQTISATEYKCNNCKGRFKIGRY